MAKQIAYIDKKTFEELNQREQSIFNNKCAICGADLVEVFRKKDGYGQRHFFGCSNFELNGCKFTVNASEYYQIKYTCQAPLTEYEKLNFYAIEALTCAVELHNKPLLNYKYQAVITLFVNAWELLLKAIIVKHEGINAIFEDLKMKNTISMTSAINKVMGYNLSKYNPHKLNIETLNELRNEVIHFYIETDRKMEVVYYGLLAKSMEYLFSIASDFGFENAEFDFLPLVTKFYNSSFKVIGEMLESEETSKRIKSFLTKLKSDSENIGEPILYDFDVRLQQLKNQPLNKLIVGVSDQSDSIIKTEKTYSLGDKNAQSVIISSTDFIKFYPYCYKQLLERTTGVKGAQKRLNQKTKEYKKLLEGGNKKYCNRQEKHPIHRTLPPLQYTQAAYDEIQLIVEEIKRGEKNEQ